MSVLRIGVAVILGGALLASSGCGSVRSSPAVAPPPTSDDWVIVTFDATEQAFDLETMDALLETELAADEALRSSGEGWIDGNEIGDNRYDLFFVGNEAAEMWVILEPVFAEAPIAWSFVELRDGFDDPDPVRVEPGL